MRGAGRSSAKARSKSSASPQKSRPASAQVRPRAAPRAPRGLSPLQRRSPPGRRRRRRRRRRHRARHRPPRRAPGVGAAARRLRRAASPPPASGSPTSTCRAPARSRQPTSCAPPALKQGRAAPRARPRRGPRPRRAGGLGEERQGRSACCPTPWSSPSIERRLLAVWEHDGRAGVIDADRRGRRPRPIPASSPACRWWWATAPTPRPADILPLVQQRRGSWPRLDALVRVDDRRWDLRLKDGGVIQLPADGRGGGADAARSARSGLAHPRSRLRADRPARSGDGCRAAPGESARPVLRRGWGWMRLAVREDRAAFAEAERKSGGRDGLKVGAGPPAGGGGGGSGRLEGRLLHHEAGRRAPRPIAPSRPPASATCSRAACAAARSSTWTKRPSAIAQAVERAEADGRRQRPRRHRRHRRRPARQPPASSAKVSLGARPISDADLSARHRPRPWPGLRLPGRRADPPAADRLVGRRPASGVRDPALHVRPRSSASTCWWSR